MAWNVHLHVCFACDDNESLAELAKKHLEMIKSIEEENIIDECREIGWFLDDLSTKEIINGGPKGGLCVWGLVGNHTNTKNFVELLRPFWKELFEIEHGPFDFEHITVFYEQEGSEQAKCFEISLNELSKELDIKHHELPFCWGQF